MNEINSVVIHWSNKISNWLKYILLLIQTRPLSRNMKERLKIREHIFFISQFPVIERYVMTATMFPGHKNKYCINYHCPKHRFGRGQLNNWTNFNCSQCTNTPRDWSMQISISIPNILINNFLNQYIIRTRWYDEVSFRKRFSITDIFPFKLILPTSKFQ